MQLRIVALLALCPLLPAQTDAGLWRFVHPNAKALIGIDVQRIRTSRVAEEMAQKWNTLLARMPFQMPGMDLLRSIDRVVLSSPGLSSPDSKEEAPLLIAVSGRFEPVKLREMFVKAGAKPQVFNSVTIYRPQSGSRDLGFVVLNSQTLLIGDAKSLFAAIERVEKNPAGPPPAIVERARDMDVAYDFWAILSTPPAAMGSDRFPIANMAGNVKGFEFGIAVRDGIAMDVNVTAISETAAKAISGEFSKLIHVASKDKEGQSEWSELARNVKVVVDRADVHFTVRLGTAEIARLAKAMEEARARRAIVAIKEPVPGQPPVKPLEPKPEPKMFIRIDGLDGGPREIPYHPENH